jgi:DNA-binding YbaB/EbfC family protein
MMKQAQKLQAKLARIEAELAQKQVEGTAGGGVVVVTANGRQEIVGIKIDPEVVDREDVEMLEDLILAATEEARRKSRALAEHEMQRATAGLLPPGMGLPGLI